MSQAALTVLHNDEPLPSPSFAVTPVTPMAMISQAVASGANMEMIEKLMALHEKIEANQARKAFDAALAAAKAEFPVITKNRHVSYESQDRKSRTEYSHEDLGEIARAIDPILGKHGLSYRFDTKSDLNQPIIVTCILGHRDGHTVTNTLMAARDDSGKKNAIQQMGSTITYLQRYTLKAALGLASSADDDGRASGGDVDADVVNEEQLGDLVELMGSVNADKPRFLKHFQIEALGDLPASKFEQAVRMLNAKSGGR